MTIGEFLKQLGLNEKQIDVYLDLAAYPDSTVVEISHRIKFPRSSIYLELDRLVQKGLVLSMKVGKTMKFSITDPNNLKVRILDESDKFRYLINNVENFAKYAKGVMESYELGKEYADAPGLVASGGGRIIAFLAGQRGDEVHIDPDLNTPKSIQVTFSKASKALKTA